ncbi:Dimeric dihydrodiol dehydrogenase [Handroanthus impetiginosus]|uniref:Dimeric dihydrodiol dehydrogenase n=1 Tax=Handroanthus impetiginosus TaxID=429701 RepID=A0A2G9HI96_9LAMI|nr:Dimeric dihydrodiol dehydrogenase [Handroanthus impetiginosus]
MAENENPIRFGIIGCAEIARKVSRAINLSPNATLIAIASRSIPKVKRFAIKNKVSENVKLYGSYEELLDDPSVDAVYMPLPTSLHVKWAVMATEKGKHLLLEKPTALDVKMFDEMFEACERNRVQFMDASMWYHHPRTVKMKELISNSEIFGRVKAIHSSSSYQGTAHFLENDIRVKPDLDSLGALGDTGWYCIGTILWTMNQKLPTTVTALPGTVWNSARVILSCSASLYWDEEETVATFYCSFISHETMDLAVCGTNGTLHVEDFIIPYDENSAAFSFTSGAKFVDMHIGWNVKPQQVQVDTPLPQEALMIQEFSRLVKGIKEGRSQPDSKWAQTSRVTQLVLDAVKNSIDNGYKAIQMHFQFLSGCSIQTTLLKTSPSFKV